MQSSSMMVNEKELLWCKKSLDKWFLVLSHCTCACLLSRHPNIFISLQLTVSWVLQKEEGTAFTWHCQHNMATLTLLMTRCSCPQRLDKNCTSDIRTGNQSQHQQRWGQDYKHESPSQQQDIHLEDISSCCGHAIPTNSSTAIIIWHPASVFPYILLCICCK